MDATNTPPQTSLKDNDVRETFGKLPASSITVLVNFLEQLIDFDAQCSNLNSAT